jgi:spermidine synthase
MTADVPPASLGFPSRPLFRCALFLAFFSGFAALIHQLLWTRRMVDLLGASGESTSRVFGSFFLGLALGAALATWLLARRRNPWVLAGMAELLVAVTAVGVLTLPYWTDGIWGMIGSEAFVGAAGGFIKLGLSTMVIGIPAFFMGLVLPALADGIASRGGKASLGREGIWLYATNTLGGAAGLLLASALLIERLGATNSMLAALALNAGIGVCCLWIARSEIRKSAGKQASSPPPRQEAGPRDVPFPDRPWLPGLIAFLSGAGILAAEVAANQLIMLVATLSFYAPATILFCVIFMLAMGAFAATPLLRITRSWNPNVRLCLVLGASGIAFALTPSWFMALARHAKFLKVNDTLLEFFLELGGVVVVASGPAFFLAGLIFPFVMAENNGYQKSIGSRLAGLLALNGIGGFLGAEIACRVLLPVAGPHGALGLVGIGYAFWALLISAFTSHTRTALAAVGALVLTVSMLKQIEKLPLINPNLGFKVLSQRAGREGTVAVVEDKRGHRSILMSNQYILGGTGARASQERQAWLPLMLHPNPQEVAFIGLATGTTPGAALADPRVRHVSAIEISPLVREAAQFFTESNRNILDDPRASIFIEDGRTYLASCRNRFDVIAGDLFLPWGPGEARLYSLEHFHAVRRALKEGGLFCQWLPLYQLTPSQLEIIAATFQQVFPDTYVFASPAGDPRPVLALVGLQGDGKPQVQTGRLLEHGKLEEFESFSLGSWPMKSPSRINTLGNLAIELNAALERLTGQPGKKYLHGNRWENYRAELSK